jgi:hypothetical protein
MGGFGILAPCELFAYGWLGTSSGKHQTTRSMPTYQKKAGRLWVDVINP